VSELVFMLTVTAATCVAVGVGGWLVLNALRRRSVTVSVVVCALVPVVAVIAAVQVNVQAMFLSEHDAEVIAFVLTTAAALAVALAVILGRRLAAGSRSIGARLTQLTAAYPEVPAAAGRPASAELAALTAQLDEVHRELAASRARERALETSRRDLVAALSHDLRTPLAGIRALAEGLEDGVVTDLPAALAQIRANTERLAHTADDLFELSRLQAVPRWNRPSALVSLRELVEDVVAEIRPGAEARGVRLEVEIADRLPVRGDARELSRVVENLVANAVRHTPADGVVTVRSGMADGGVRLSVADGCGGIPVDDLPHLFEPGWRGRAGRNSDPDPGSGLGLAIVAEVVAAHRGSVAAGNVDGGCRFDVWLPAASPSARAT
jgi:signal transduction histidine kinase